MFLRAYFLSLSKGLPLLNAARAAKQLKVVGRAGIGVDNVDVGAATKRGIVVMNTPGGNNITTAEHAIALIVSLARHIPQATASMKAGKWEKKKFTGAWSSTTPPSGVIGLGNIGRIVADRAKGLGMKVIAHDPFISERPRSKLEFELVFLRRSCWRARTSSRSTFRRPRTPTGLLDQPPPSRRCKPGLLVINAARGGIVDEAALLAALDRGRSAARPSTSSSRSRRPRTTRWSNHEKVICTPHLGAATDQAQVNVAIAVAEQVRDYLLNGIVGNAVNVPVDLA